MRILIEPKNALIRQYKKFSSSTASTSSSVTTPSRPSPTRHCCGARRRGLRAILEEVLLNVMYDLPSRNDVGRCVIDRSVVLEKVNPTLVPRSTCRQGRAAPPGRVLTRPAPGLYRARVESIPDFAAAVAYLDSHVNLEPILRRRARRQPARAGQGSGVLRRGGSSRPHSNGCAACSPTSASRSSTCLSSTSPGRTARIDGAHGDGPAAGLRPERGTYTSPHLQKVTERIAFDGHPIADADFAAVLQVVARAEALSGSAARFRAHDGGRLLVVRRPGRPGRVVEVAWAGGGRHQHRRRAVAVVTNVELDHMEYFGDTRREIALEKAAS